MKALRYFLLLCIAGYMFVSCYEDKGNYTYNEDIHDITVKLNSSYGLRKSDEVMTYTITPEITTVDGDKSYLEYVWIMTNDQTGIADTASVTESVTVEIDPNSSDFSYSYSFLLYVTDTRTNGMTMVPTTLEIAKPFEYSWVVLHETDDHAELGTVEYIGSTVLVSPTAYTDEQGKSFSGKPLRLGLIKNSIESGYWEYSAVSQVFVVTTDLDESGLLNQINHFELKASWNELIHSSQIGDIDFNDIQFASGDAGMFAISNGIPFQNNYSSPMMFELGTGTVFEGDYYISKCAAGPNRGIGYDKTGHRFVSMTYSSEWSGYRMPTDPFSGGEISEIRQADDNAANPSQISADETIIGFVNGYRYSYSNPAAWLKFSVYAYGITSSNLSHVYVFRYAPLLSASYGAPMPYMYTFETPDGITEGTPMTSSYEFNNIIFYASGNRIYKLDISTGESTIIYSHEDPAAEITALRMAVEGYTDSGSGFTDSSNYGHPYSRCLGAGVNTSDGSGEVVILQLNTAGRIDDDQKFPSTQIYKGFGKITDIDFM